MRSKTIFRLLIASAGIAGLSWLVTRLVMAQTEHPKAFTIHYVETTGSRPPLDTYYSQRADGSKVTSRLMLFPDQKYYSQKTVYDVASGTKVVLEGGTSSKTTYHLSKATIANLTKAPTTCSQDPSPETGTILGHTVVRIVSEIPSSNRRIFEAWRAPDFGCTVLRQVVSGFDTTGKLIELVRKEAVSIAVGDPDATLFQAPDWTERSPSEVTAELDKKYHQRPISPDVLAAQDRAYRTIPPK
ncbi:MAG: hypothetical protein ABI165_17370 [Bryobacteraceae bacterium]